MSPEGIAGLLNLPASVVDFLPLGVVVLNQRGEVVMYNRYEETLARRRREDVIGRHFFTEVARCTDVPALHGEFRDRVASQSLVVDLEHAFDLPFHPRPRDVRLLMNSFATDGEPHAVLLIEDISVRKELERQRDRLVATFVHDLRSPMTGALGYAQLLDEGDFGSLSEDQVDAVRTIRETCERMSRLITTTMDDLRGSERRQAQPVNMHALVLSGINAILPAARERGLDVWYNGMVERAEFPNHAVVVPGYADELGRVVDNLLSNAAKYARGEVRVALQETPGGVVLEVGDDGPGIPPEYRERIFEDGFQVPGSRPGHGVGLASVASAVQLHGADITVDSSSSGSTFRVVLPAG